MPTHVTDAPLSRPLALTAVPPDGLIVEVFATPGERAALARLNDVQDVLSCAAKLRVRRWRGEGLEITGDIAARLRQTCVVTLEEFETDIKAPVEVQFAPPRDDAPRSRRRQPEGEPHEFEVDNAPDPLIGGTVDLGAVVSEFLTLAIDPYPRKPGAAFAEPATEPEHDIGKVSPFAALRDKKP